MSPVRQIIRTHSLVRKQQGGWNGKTPWPTPPSNDTYTNPRNERPLMRISNHRRQPESLIWHMRLKESYDGFDRYLLAFRFGGSHTCGIPCPLLLPNANHREAKSFSLSLLGNTTPPYAHDIATWSTASFFWPVIRRLGMAMHLRSSNTGISGMRCIYDVAYPSNKVASRYIL